MQKYDMEKLVNRICYEYGIDKENAYNKALQIKESCPPVLFQNVQEWSEHQILTDIYIGKYSLPMIMSIWNNRDFLKAMEVMNELSDGKIETAELKIWNMRR